MYGNDINMMSKKCFTKQKLFLYNENPSKSEANVTRH